MAFRVYWLTSLLFLFSIQDITRPARQKVRADVSSLARASQMEIQSKGSEHNTVSNNEHATQSRYEESAIEPVSTVNEHSNNHQDESMASLASSPINKAPVYDAKTIHQTSSSDTNPAAASSNSQASKLTISNSHKHQTTSKLSSSTPSTSRILPSTSSTHTKLHRFHWRRRQRRRPCYNSGTNTKFSFSRDYQNLPTFHHRSISPGVPAKQPPVPRVSYLPPHLVPRPIRKERISNKNNNKIGSMEENGVKNEKASTSVSGISLRVDETSVEEGELDENDITTYTSITSYTDGRTIQSNRRKRAASYKNSKQVLRHEKRNKKLQIYMSQNKHMHKDHKNLIQRIGSSGSFSTPDNTTLSSIGNSLIPGYHSVENGITINNNENGKDRTAEDSHNRLFNDRYHLRHYHQHHHHHHHHRLHRRHRPRRQSPQPPPRRSRPGQRSRNLFGRNFDSSRRRVSPGATRFGSGRNGTGSVKKLSLKVVVHNRVNLHYQRVLDRSIAATEKDREFFMLMKHVRATGSVVKLRTDNPKYILQAFCRDIMTPDTTIVTHLINPFYHSRNWDSARFVASLLATLNVPHITWGPEYIGALDKKESDDTQLNISPTLHHQARALIALLTYYKWPFFAVVYTKAPGHDAFITSIRTALNDYNNDTSRHHKDSKNHMPEEHKLELLISTAMTNVSDEAQTREDLKQVKKTDARVVVLYCKDVETFHLLAQASKLGMLSREYVWILSFEAVNKNKEQNAKYLPVGLLGFQYNYRNRAMERAIRTAVKVWFYGLKEAILSNTDTSKPGTPQGLPWKLPRLQCKSNSTLEWRSGSEFYKYLRNVSFSNIAFDETGQLDSTNISIFNVQTKGGLSHVKKWVEIGKWTNSGIAMKQITWPGGATTPPRGKPERHFLRIVTREEPPFVEYRDLNKNGTCDMFSSPCSIYARDANETRLSSTTIQKCCTGLSIEILRKLSVALDFEFHLYEVPDFQWGTKMANGEWNGIVGELRAGHADMGVASMTIDEDKSSAINFSTPYMETGITFIVAIREGAVSATAFLEPYDSPSWCLILLCSVHVTGASIFLFEWLSPSGMDHGKKAASEHRFSLFRAFWLMWAMLFGAAVTTDTPRGVSSKFLSNIWALFALVFTASYTANLAAFMITKEEFYDLSGMQDWRLQNPYFMNPPFRFATVPNGTAESNIKKNNPWMHQYMSQFSQRSVEHAIEALKSQELHAFIYDASVLKYQEGKDKDCLLITVGNWYATTGYGVAFPLGSPWLDRVNKVLLKLQYEGEMDRLKEFWLAGACHLKRKKNNNDRGIGNGVSSATLGILNFASAFIFLLAGTGLAAIVFAMEFCFFWFGRKKLSSWSNKDCCNLISLSMGMTLSFRDSVREAMEAHKKAHAKLCKSVVCETKLWKANYDLRHAREEIGKLQCELERLNLKDSSLVGAQYEAIEYNSQDIASDDLEPRDDDNSQSHNRDSKVKEHEKETANQEPHRAEVHNLHNGEVTTQADQSNWPACLLNDNDDDEEASVRVTLL